MKKKKFPYRKTYWRFGCEPCLMEAKKKNDAAPDLLSFAGPPRWTKSEATNDLAKHIRLYHDGETVSAWVWKKGPRRTSEIVMEMTSM